MSLRSSCRARLPCFGQRDVAGEPVSPSGTKRPAADLVHRKRQQRCSFRYAQGGNAEPVLRNRHWPECEGFDKLLEQRRRRVAILQFENQPAFKEPETFVA